MSPEVWERIKAVFNEVSDSRPDDRARILSGLEPSERREVERMLATGSDSERLFGSTASMLPGRNLIAALIREQHAFEEGQILLDRFEIRRFLGGGGMGEVYEAHDRKLGPVAIKTLRLELTNDKSTLESFRREVTRGRRVAHPNVCRIYDLFELPGSEIPFFTMELLPGQTLGSAVQSRGGFKESEALKIALELCAGLQAAHDASIIHGDLKTGNVILAEDAGGTTRAKITDFGLAGLKAIDNVLEPRDAGAIAGTKQYLSLELMSAAPPSVASDLFALGVVLYYVVTSRYPFDSQGSWERVKSERTKPPSQRELTETFSSGWVRAIASCLAVDPGERPASAQTVGAMLAGTEPKGKLVTRRGLLYAFAGTTAVTAGAETWRRYRLPPALPGGKLKTLIEEFETVGAPPSVGRAVRNLLKLSFESSKRIQVVSARAVQTEMEKMGVGGQPLRGRVAREVASRTMARISVSGTVQAEGARYRIACQAVDLQSNQILFGPRKILTAAKDVPAATGKISRLIRERLGAEPQLAAFGAASVEEIDTERADALERFTLGLSYYRSGEPEAALENLREATRLDPDFAVAYCYQALVLYAFRRGDQALAPIRKAYDLRQKLGSPNRLYIEFYNYLLSGDWDRAHQQLQLLLKFFPDDPDLNRQMAQSYALLEQPENALAPARRTAQLDPDNPMNLSMLIAILGENERMDEANAALKTAFARYPESPPLLYIQGHLHLLSFRTSEALEVLGRLANGRQSATMANTQMLKALMLGARWSEARQQLERQISLKEVADSRQVQSVYRYWLGQVSLVQNDRDGAARQAQLLVEKNDAIPSNLAAIRTVAELGWLSNRPALVRAARDKLRTIARDYPSTRSLGFQHMADALDARMEGDTERSSAAMIRANEFWPDLTNLWVSGELYLQSRRFAEAATSFEAVAKRRTAAIRSDATNLWVRSLARLAICLELTGHQAQADDYWNRFKGLWGAPSQYSFTQASLRKKFREQFEFES